MAASAVAAGATSPAREGEEQNASRRGVPSLRARTLSAFEEASFPPYPSSPPPAEEPFALPPGIIDNDAPISARKWCA